MSYGLVILTETRFRSFYSEETLGKTFDINVGGKRYLVHTPQNDNVDIGWLSPPWGYGVVGNYSFGYKYDSDSQRISIDAVIVEAQGDSGDEFEVFNQLSSKIDKYLKRFDDWAIVLSGQLYTETRLSQGYQKDMYWLKNHERLKVSPETCIESFLCDHFRLIDSAQIRKIIEAIRDNRDYPLELEYYKSAILAYREQRYADCVLDSAIASEVYIRKMIAGQHKWTSVDEKKEKMSGLHGLSALYEFGGKNGCVLPSAKHKNISGPRNKAVHEGEAPCMKDAKESLKETRKILLGLLVF